MLLIDPNHPFFRPLWRRVLTVLAPIGWGLFELSNDAPGWAILFIAAGLYAGWTLFGPASKTGDTKNDDPET